MKKSEIYFSVMQVFLDWLAIMSAAVIAFWLRDNDRVQALIEKGDQYALGFDQYMMIVFVVSLLVLAIFAFEGLYRVRATRRLFSEFARVAKGTTIAVVFVMIIDLLGI